MNTQDKSFYLKQTEALKLELQRIRSIVGQVTGLDDEDEDNLRDAYKSIDRVIDSLAEQPAQQRPQNCGTGYCSCIECLFEQPAQQPPCKYPHCSYPCPDLLDCRDAEQPAIKQNLTPEQHYKQVVDGVREVFDAKRKPAQQQEPVAFVNADHLQGLTLGNYGHVEIYTDESAGRIPIYTSPQSKPWVGLTNKDIYECEPKTDWYDSVEFGRAIEAKLREKNA